MIGMELYDVVNGRYINVIRQHFSDWECRVTEPQFDDDGEEAEPLVYEQIFTTAELKRMKRAGA